MMTAIELKLNKLLIDVLELCMEQLYEAFSHYHDRNFLETLNVVNQARNLIEQRLLNEAFKNNKIVL